MLGQFVRSIVPDKPVKFRFSGLIRSREISPEDVGGGIFDRSLNFDNCQSKTASDVVSGSFVDPTDASYRRSKNDGVRLSSHKDKTPFCLKMKYVKPTVSNYKSKINNYFHDKSRLNYYRQSTLSRSSLTTVHELPKTHDQTQLTDVITQFDLQP